MTNREPEFVAGLDQGDEAGYFKAARECERKVLAALDEFRSELQGIFDGIVASYGDDEAALRELFPGTLDALDAINLRREREIEDAIDVMAERYTDDEMEEKEEKR